MAIPWGTIGKFGLKYGPGLLSSLGFFGNNEKDSEWERRKAKRLRDIYQMKANAAIRKGDYQDARDFHLGVFTSQYIANIGLFEQKKAAWQQLQADSYAKAASMTGRYAAAGIIGKSARRANAIYKAGAFKESVYEANKLSSFGWAINRANQKLWLDLKSKNREAFNRSKLGMLIQAPDEIPKPERDKGGIFDTLIGIAAPFLKNRLSMNITGNNLSGLMEQGERDKRFDSYGSTSLPNIYGGSNYNPVNQQIMPYSDMGLANNAPDRLSGFNLSHIYQS